MTDDSLGTAVARRVNHADGTHHVELIQADERISVARELLTDHDPRWMQVDGQRLVICGVPYLATGETDSWGNPIYRRVRNEGDL